MHLPFDETDGVVAGDVSGNGHDGSLHNGAGFDPSGQLGGALLLDGSDDYVDVADHPDLNTGEVTERSVSVWFHAEDVSVTGRKQVVYEEGGTVRGLSIYLHGGRLYVAGWNDITKESGWAGTFLSTDQIASGRWHHVTLILQGDTSVQPDALVGYLDGVEFASGDGSQLWPHSADIGIGAMNDDTRFHDGEVLADLGHALAGRIDDLRVYNRVLSSSEVESLAGESSVDGTPVAVAGDDQSVLVDEMVVLDGSGSFDPDGDPLTYLWEQTSGPVVTLSGAEEETATFTPSEEDSYVFRLTVDDGTATSSDEVTVTAEASDLDPPEAPTGLVVVGVSDSSVSLDWADNLETDLAGYNVYRDVSSGFAPGPDSLIASGVSSSEFTDTGLAPDTTYFYLVSAVDVAGNESAFSAEVSAVTDSAPSGRVTDGLLVLYDFEEGAGTTVHDVGGVGSALDLTIQDSGAVTWISGGLSVDSSVVIASDGPATKVIDGAVGSDEMTIEAWITPANTTQNGPARIVSLSGGTGSRNFTLGQGLDNGDSDPTDFYDIRFRTTEVDDQGMPSTSTPPGSLSTTLQHIVYVRASSGAVTVYVNGEQVAENLVGGDLSNWDTTFPLLLANETSGDRPWLGQYHLIALYERALSPTEVGQNYAAGPAG